MIIIYRVELFFFCFNRFLFSFIPTLTQIQDSLKIQVKIAKIIPLMELLKIPCTIKLDSEKFKILSRDIIRIYSLKNQTFENSLNTIKLDSEKFKILSRDIIRIYSLKNQTFENSLNNQVGQ
jgi:hypothetical protein